jgi:hypothetical protein
MLYKDYRQAEDKRRELADRETELMAEIREIGTELYADTGDKNLGWGCKIRVYHMLGYNPEEAREWAVHNAPAVLVLDKKRFEEVAVALGAPVTQTKKPRVAINRNLDEFLEGAS